MTPSELHVITARSNPLGWKVPHRNWVEFAGHMLDSGVSLTVAECAYGDAPFACALPGVHHVGVRAKTRTWNKENLINIGIQRAPEGQYFAWIDADVRFHDPHWAERTLDALQHYAVVQPWSDCYDLGPNGEHLAHHRSFARQFFNRQPMAAPPGKPFWHGDGGPYSYPHSGYAWATTRAVLDATGGLFELGAMGSGDFHMAMAFIGHVDASIPGGVSAGYRTEVRRWAHRAMKAVNRNLGVVTGTISHSFHGRKQDRNYISRWDMFLKHGFDPAADLIRNTYGVIEFDPERSELRHDFDMYLHRRMEDGNLM